MDYFYRNAQAYETWWVHEGSGVLKSQFGNLKFRKGDYIVIPFGTTWQMHIDGDEAQFFTIENPSQIEPPKRYRNNSVNCSSTHPTASAISGCRKNWKHTRNAANLKCVSKSATG